MSTFIAAAAILIIAVLAMFVFMFKKDGEFPKYDVGSNEEMRKRGIRCFKDVDAEIHGRKCSGNFSEACRECGLYELEKKKS